MLELYNEQLHDLLAGPAPLDRFGRQTSQQTLALQVRAGGVCVCGGWAGRGAS